LQKEEGSTAQLSQNANKPAAHMFAFGLLQLHNGVTSVAGDCLTCWLFCSNDCHVAIAAAFHGAGAAADSPLVPSWSAVLLCISLFVTQVSRNALWPPAAVPLRHSAVLRVSLLCFQLPAAHVWISKDACLSYQCITLRAVNTAGLVRKVTEA
jgi:hypothetical protein